MGTDQRAYSVKVEGEEEEELQKLFLSNGDYECCDIAPYFSQVFRCIPEVTSPCEIIQKDI
jgi:hypothetical protein